MNKNEIQPRIKQVIENLLKETGLLIKTGYIQSKQIFFEQNTEKYPVDLMMDVMINGDNAKLVIEIKSNGEPRQIRATVQQLLEYIIQFNYSGIANSITPKINEQIYGIIAVPYITEESARICKENNVGYIDLAGNCFIKFGKIFIERKNYPNSFIEKRIVKSIFTPKASRILRVMLSNPKRRWQLQELAKESGVSLGQAYKVKERMFELEYATGNKKNIILKNPAELLSKWSNNYPK